VLPVFFKVEKTRTEFGFSYEIQCRCPVCHQDGVFEDLYSSDLIITSPNEVRICQRRCPNPICRAYVIFILQKNEIIQTYPAERIDFDTTNIPSSIIQAFEEAIACHANQCFIAAAIMVRKTLEELCHERGATGANLKERIKKSGTMITLPNELIAGLDDLRLLGNDAAHIESEEYNQVGEEEVEVGIEFTKEVLKATYQYSRLLSKLRGLKKSLTP
jgi:Domain of unknown function (DUF4145)